MKKFKLTIITTSNEEWYYKNATDMQREIISGEYKKQLMYPKDIEEGLQDVEITFEDLPL